MKTKEFFEHQYNQRLRKTIVAQEVSSIWKSLNIIKKTPVKEQSHNLAAAPLEKPKNFVDLNLIALLGFRRGKDRLEMHDLMMVIKKAGIFSKSDVIIKACDKNAKPSSVATSMKDLEPSGVKKQVSEQTVVKKKVTISKELPAPKSFKDRLADMRKRNNTFALTNTQSQGPSRFPSVVPQEDSEETSAKKAPSLVNIESPQLSRSPTSPNKGYLIDKFLTNIREMPRFKFEISELFAKCIVLAFFEISKENKIMLKYLN